jgi:hypothetical protein
MQPLPDALGAGRIALAHLLTSLATRQGSNGGSPRSLFCTEQVAGSIPPGPLPDAASADDAADVEPAPPQVKPAPRADAQ